MKILVSEAGGLFGVVADLGKVGHDFAVPDQVWLTTNVLSFCWICKKTYIPPPGVPFRLSVHNSEFLQRSALLTTHHCSISGFPVVTSLHCFSAMPANKNKCTHQTAVTLQTFLPCSSTKADFRLSNLFFKFLEGHFSLFLLTLRMCV